MENLNLIKPEKVQNIINKFCYTIGMIPTSYKISLTYEEQIVAIGKYLEETVIPALNNNAEAVAELQNLFIQLKDYIENYFDNLDVQNEINIKLDEMAKDGTLSNLINNYLTTIKTYPTFVDIQNNPNSISKGNTIKTLGYYNINDGGAALYTVTDIEDNTIYQEKIGNLYLNLITDKMINILQIGCNEIDNNTEKIQSVLNLGYDIFIPEKTFLIDSIELKFNKQKIQGLGLKSVLKANTINQGLINILSDIIDTEITDISLNGNNKTGDGIYVNHTSLNEDSKEFINNIFIGYFNGNSINFSTANIHSAIISNCKCRNCSNGILINGTDNFIDNTICYFNTNHGLFINDSGSNLKVSNSKFYGNQNCGIYCKASACNFSNVESQDNYQQGLYIKGWNNNINILCGNNGQQNSANGQIYCDGLNDSIINACVNVTENPLTIQQVSKYALECNGLNTNNIINIQTHKFGKVNIIPFKYNPNVSNKITINGVKYFPNNILENKKLGKVGTVENLSEMFSNANIRPNSNGNIYCSQEDQTQYLNIGNNNTADYTGGITIAGQIDLDSNVSKADIYLGLTNNLSYDSDIATIQLILQWLNAGGGEISNKTINGTMNLFISDIKPENATKLQYQINFFPKKLNIQQKIGITNLQIGLYS